MYVIFCDNMGNRKSITIGLGVPVIKYGTVQYVQNKGVKYMKNDRGDCPKTKMNVHRN